MYTLINRYLPEEMIRLLQAVYWSIRLVILVRDI
jgi:hypothetical protein